MREGRLAGLQRGRIAGRFPAPRNLAAALLLAAALAALAGCGGSGKTASTRSAGTAARSTPTSAGRTAATSPTSTAPPAEGASTATGNAAAGHVASASVAGVQATLTAGTHTPRVNVPWPVRFTVTRGGRAVPASVEYEFLFGNTVVAHRSHYRFAGRFSDTILWPASAVGYPLTWRAVIVSGRATINLDYPVQVRR